MARNEEKHYGMLNRIYLMKEKEEYEKANPKRPRLDTLFTPEEIQKWLPSIKKDIDFYLKKSQVTCYSDAHIEDCRAKVIKLEKEFKAFVRKIKQLTPSPLEVIPWTNRPYKRKKPNDSEEKDSSSKEFKRIPTPILDGQKTESNFKTSQCEVDWNLMNQPLEFSCISTNDGKTEKEKGINSSNISNQIGNSNLENCNQYVSLKTRAIQRETLNYCIGEHAKVKDNQLRDYSISEYAKEKDNQLKDFSIDRYAKEKDSHVKDYSIDRYAKDKYNQLQCSIVNYDSSDSDSS